jgi:cellobiose phosphorylase
LRIAPTIPSSWSGFKARRIFRGVIYDISVERAGKGNLVSLKVDGQPIEGDVVPLPSTGRREVVVEAILT